ncbi:MAG: hypothetical protein ACT4NY_18390 [Pseudonocardiales bacterium]
MSWQDELRRLDEDMAAGRVSTDDYRRRYDELTAQGRDQRSETEAPAEAQIEGQAEAKTEGQAEAKTEGQAETKTEGQAETGPGNMAEQGRAAEQGSTAEQPQSDEGSSPFPPAFRWDNPSPNETTQVIEPLGTGDRPGDAERTQVVRTPTQPPPGPTQDDSERTQVVQVPPPAPSPYEQPTYQRDSFSTGGGGFPTGGQAPWTPQESTPPWVSSDLPPIPEPNAGWMMQGPEFFEPEQKPSGAGRIIAIVAAVVVLAGIAVGAWLLWGQQNSPIPGPSTAQPPGQPTSAAPAPEDPLAPADVGGLFIEEKDVESFRDLGAIGFLTTEELGTLAAAGAGESRLLITNFNEGKATILVCQAISPARAISARDELTVLQIGYGFIERTAPPGVNAVEALNRPDAAPIVRALFASDDLVIRIEMISNSPGDSPTAMTAKFEEILEQQLEKLPANA